VSRLGAQGCERAAGVRAELGAGLSVCCGDSAPARICGWTGSHRPCKAATSVPVMVGRGVVSRRPPGCCVPSPRARSVLSGASVRGRAKDGAQQGREQVAQRQARAQRTREQGEGPARGTRPAADHGPRRQARAPQPGGTVPCSWAACKPEPDGAASCSSALDVEQGSRPYAEVEAHAIQIVQPLQRDVGDADEEEHAQGAGEEPARAALARRCVALAEGGLTLSGRPLPRGPGTDPAIPPQRLCSQSGSARCPRVRHSGTPRTLRGSGLGPRATQCSSRPGRH
jgi:hypothetical protein